MRTTSDVIPFGIDEKVTIGEAVGSLNWAADVFVSVVFCCHDGALVLELCVSLEIMQ